MRKFPRTQIGGLSVSRMIIGSNWFCGYSHTSKAQDDYIKEHIHNREAMAKILEVFFRAGVDTFMANMTDEVVRDAVHMAEDATGVGCNMISSLHFTITPETPAKGFDLGEVERILDEQAALGVKICQPHQVVTDAMADKCTREIRQMAPVMRMCRERGLIPALSTHMPETIQFADESGLDVESYIQIYNSMGFLMQVEVDTVHAGILAAKKPVMTIKPMAAGQLRPFQALHFVWSTLRPCDMVTVGCMSPQEAQECIDLSLEIFDKLGQ